MKLLVLNFLISRRLFSFLLISLSINSFGQTSQDSLPGWEVTYSPSALLNPYIGVQFGLTRNFNENIAIEFEVARIPKQDQLNASEIYKAGFRYKLGFRNRLKGRWIFLTTAYLRNTVHQHSEEVLIDELFFQEIRYQRSKKLKGMTIGFAYCRNINDSKFSAEWGLNLGLGTYKVRNSGIPENAELLRFGNGNFEYLEGDYIYPIVGLIIKVRYKLGEA